MYRVFYHVVRSGSISGAAQELFITQPSVSHAVKQLEQKLGMQLLHRGAKGVSLTSEGEQLYAYVHQAYHLLAAAEKKMADLKKLEAGELKIGVSGSLVKHYLLPYLEAYYREYPQIRLRLVHGKTADIANMLHEGNIDIGIVHLPVDDERLETFPTLTIQDIFVAGGAYRHFAEQPISLNDLLDQPLVLLSAASSQRTFLSRIAAAYGAEIKPAIELGNIELLAEFAKLGFGIAFVPQSFVAAELAAGTIAHIPLIEPIPPRQVGIATLRNAPLSQAAQKFARLMSGGQEIAR
nr:LysR family transcriptional regulator [Paenibacillus hamazuiensis]